MASKRIPAKVRAEAIECLLTCAADRQARGSKVTWDVLPMHTPAEELACDAFDYVESEFHGYEEGADCYASAAMQLHLGWSP